MPTAPTDDGPARKSGAKRRSFLAAWLGLGLGLAVYGGLIAQDAWRDRKRIETSEGARLLGNARIVADNLGLKIRSTANAIQSVFDDVPHSLGAEDPSLTSKIKSLVLAIPGIGAIAFLDARGDVRFANVDALVGGNFAARDYFRATREASDPDVLLLSAPFISGTGDWSMALTRKVVAPDGAFAGLIVATLDPGYFRALLGAANYATDMWSAVAHGDGVQFVMVPDRAGQSGRNLMRPGSMFSNFRASGQTEIVDTGLVLATGEKRVMAIRSVSVEGLRIDKDVVIAVGRDADAVLAPWRDYVRFQVGLWLTLSTLVVVGLGLFQRYSYRVDSEEQAARAELAAIETRYQYLFDRSPLPMLVYRMTDTKIVDVNRAALDQYGFSREEFLALGLEGIRPPDELPKLRSVLAALPPGGYRGEFRHRRKDGSVMDVEVWNRPIDYRGVPARITVIVDVTEKKLAEEARRKLSRAVEQSPASIAITDAAGLLEYVNPKFERSTGYAASEVLGQNMRSLKSGETTIEEYRDLWTRITSGQDWRGEFHNRRKDGTLFWEAASISPIRAEDGRITHFLAVKEDITLAKEIDIERRLHAIAFESQQGIVITDASGIVRKVNRGFSALTGYEPDEIVGRNVSTLQSGRHDRAFFGAMWTALRERGAWQGEIWNRRRGGEVFPAWLAIGAVHDQRGNVVNYVGSFQDITDRKEIERAMDRARLAAEEANRAKSAFLATMSHEIRTPLNALIGFSELIANQTHGPIGEGRYVDYAKDLVVTSRHLLEVLNEVIDISRIDSDRYDIKILPFDVGEFVGRTQRLIVKMAADRGHQARFATNPGAVALADGKAMRQILINLVSNAVKYTLPGGRIAISAGTEGTSCYLRVADTGVGMRGEDIPRALRPFERLQDPLTGNQEGTGLGLTVVKRLVDAMNGELRIESQIGKGTTVTVLLSRPSTEIRKTA